MASVVTVKLNVGKGLVITNNKLALKLSTASDNGLYFASGKLCAKKGANGTNGSGGTMNTAYNGIDNGNTNTASTTISVIRCNDSVTRKSNDSGDIDDCITISNIIAKAVP